jgi:hypothetical protein
MTEEMNPMKARVEIEIIERDQATAEVFLGDKTTAASRITIGLIKGGWASASEAVVFTLEALTKHLREELAKHHIPIRPSRIVDCTKGERS